MYAVFFLTFAIHVAFCIWSAISPPLPLTNDWSHTGFVTSIKVGLPETAPALSCILLSSLPCLCCWMLGCYSRHC